eukprot:scaffold454032_cov40-Prasinocladus_malaysianus.AAC.2
MGKVSPLLRHTLQSCADIFLEVARYTQSYYLFSCIFQSDFQRADCSLVDSWLADQETNALARRNALWTALRIPVADIADIAAV